MTPDGVAHVEMARAEVFNAFDEAMIAELDAVFERLGADAAVRVIVLSGQGKAFSAGADLQWMKRELTAQTISRVRITGEAREGFAAFFEKRPARWGSAP